MSIPQIAVKRPVLVTVIFLMMTLFGLYSLTDLPIDLMPDIEIPYISIITIYEGAGSEEVEEKVTKVLESALSSVENLKNLHSRSMENLSTVSCEFEYGIDLADATNSIRDKINMVRSYLPDDVDDPRIFKIDLSMMPILFLAITSEEEDIRFQKEVIEDFIQNPIERIPGVGSVGLFNAMEKQIIIAADKQKLASLGLAISDISSVIAAENLSVPGGNMQIGSFDYTLRVPGEYNDIDEVAETIIANTPMGIIRIKDVARVFWGSDDSRQFGLNNGKYMVFMMVQKQSGANTVAIAEAVKKRIAEMNGRLPKGMHIDIIRDNSEYIMSMVGNLTDSVLTAMICVMLVVVFFLRRIRSSLIVILSIPASMIIAFAFLYGFGYTLNMVSLMSLCLAVGMVVDNSIVVLDNITRHLELGERKFEAAIKGASEVGGAITASTLTTIVIFAPLFFVSGLISIFFSQLAGVIILTLAASLLSAMLLTPMVCSKILREAKHDENGNIIVEEKPKKQNIIYRAGEKFLTSAENLYSKVIEKTLRFKKTTIFVAILLFIGSLMLVPVIGLDFMPEDDQGSLQIDIELPQGTRIEETLKAAQHIERIIREEIPLEHLTRTYVRGGSNNSGFSQKIEGTNTATIGAKLISTNYRKVTVRQYAKKIRARITQEVAGIEKADFTTGGNGMGMSEKPVTIKLLNKSFEKNSLYAAKLQSELLKIKGLTDVTNDADVLKPEIAIKVDRVRASKLGLKTSMIAMAVRYSFYGQTASVYRDNGQEYDIVVKYQKGDRSNIEQLKEMELKTLNGTTVKLKDVAEITDGLTSLVVNRLNRERMVTVSANLEDDIAVGKIYAEVQQAFKNIDLPADIGVEYGGNMKQQQDTTGDLVALLFLGVILVFLVMSAQFESFIDPFVILFSIPFGISGVLLGLLIMGKSLSMPAFLGMIILVGIVVNNAIVLIDYMKMVKERDSLSTTDALIFAGGKRLRPILMTAMTTIFGMVPMMLMDGEGAAMFSPMGTAVVFGLTVSTLITLILVPSVYALVDSILVKLHLR